MIQVETVRIVELRGIRDLMLTPARRNFVISGPNGSGKSGVVDAIQFGLTGDISRLAGKGTGGLTVQKHGPHVDRRNDPAVAEVSLKLYFPDLNKTATLTRNVKSANTFALTPDDVAARAVLDEVARHPELTLSRREIIKYILVESGERSKEIQALLKLEEIGNTRGVLKTATNRTTIAYNAAQTDAENAVNLLHRHLGVKVSAAGILAAVNAHRQVLGLPAIEELVADTVLNAGAAEGGPQAAFNKATAIRDLDALRNAQHEFGGLGAKEVAAILADIAALEGDSALLDALRQRSFVERGLALVGGARCPLCDVEWEDEEHLKTHLQAKLTKSEKAEAVQKHLLNNAAVIASHARRIAALLAPVRALASSAGPAGFAGDLAAWANDLTAFARCLTTAEDVLDQKTRLGRGWLMVPVSLAAGSAALDAEIRGKPDQSVSAAAHIAYLALAQDRFNSLRQARRAKKRAKDAAEMGKLTYSIYCDVAEKHLTALYTAVEKDFSNYYREINSDDEGGFKAKFETAEGKLDLEVAFYDRGMFPPGAYHSEGHQDGMGVCLYLALLKRLLGSRFRLAVLDDVVMSVDQDHRKQFCRLLKARFPDTQFIITTHDKVWAKQMQTESLVEPKSGVAFHSWSIQTGPDCEQMTEVWEQIESALARNDVETAAPKLRRYLEHILGEVADQLGAKISYRGDFSYDLGDLWTAVICRQGELLKRAAKTANDWNDEEGKVRIEALKTARSEILTKCDGEQWIINKAIHYNEWASFTAAEFRTVVEAFKALLLQFRCPKCEFWLYVMPPRKGDLEVLRCRCMSFNLNLRKK